MSPIDGGALPKETPKVAGDHAALCFSLCRGCPTRLLRPKRGSGRALRHRSPRKIRARRELLYVYLRGLDILVHSSLLEHRPEIVTATCFSGAKSESVVGNCPRVLHRFQSPELLCVTRCAFPLAKPTKSPSPRQPRLRLGFLSMASNRCPSWQWVRSDTWRGVRTRISLTLSSNPVHRFYGYENSIHMW